MIPDTLELVTQKLLDRAKSMGADEADVIATKGQSINVDVRNGALENADRSEGAEVGLRVLVSQRQAIVSSSCLLYTSPSPRDLSTSRMPSSA